MWINGIWHKLIRKMGFKIADTGKILWTFLLTFLSGALLCYISSLPISLFLTHYGSENLPPIYLTVAFISMVFGFSYALLERKIPFKRLIIALAFVLNVVLTLLGAALISLDNNVIVIMLVVWCIMAYDLIEFAIWSVINSIYTMQQAKNSFGIIGGCQGIGGVTAGLMSPFLVSLLGIKLLIVFVGVLSLFMVLTMFILIKKSTYKEASVVEDETDFEDTIKDEPSIKSIIKNKYVLKIFALATLSIFASYAIDLAFNTAAEAHYPNAEQLASFMGVFFGLVDGIDLFLSITIFGWLLARWGTVPTLFILPTLGIIISLPILLFSQIPALIGVVFWLVVALKLWEESARGSITEMSSLLLLQPFPVKRRAFVQAKLDSIILGLATAVISITLIIISKTIGPSISVLVLLAILFFSIAIGILLTLRGDYMAAVSKAIASRLFERNKNIALSKEDLLLLQNYLVSRHPDEVIYALNFIEQIDINEFAKSINIVLNSTDNIHVKEFIIDKISTHHLDSYYSILLSFLENPSHERLQVKAYKSAALLNYGSIKEQIRQLINSPSLKLASNAIAIILNKDDDDEIKRCAQQKLKEFAQSSDPKQRSEAAIIIGKIALPADDLLEQLCNDLQPQVLDNAFYSALKLQKERFYDELVTHLQHLSISFKFIKEIKKQINIFQPILEKQFESLSFHSQLKALDLLLHVQEEQSKPFLEKIILGPHFSLRQAAMNTLVHFAKPFNEEFDKKLNQLIIDEAKYITYLHQELLLIPREEPTVLLVSVLELKKKNGLERLMLALSLYYDTKTIQKSVNGLHSTNEEERSYAIELMDSSFRINHKKILSPLLIELYLNERIENASVPQEPFYQLLRSNLIYKSTGESDAIEQLTCIASAYAIIKKSINELSIEVNNLIAHNIPLFNETLNWLYNEPKD